MDTSEIKDRINRLKQNSLEIITNTHMGFLDSLSGECNFFENEGAIIITYNDCDIQRLYFYFCAPEHLKGLLYDIPSGDYIIEKTERLGFELNIDLCDVGFREIKRLYRYTNNRIGDLLESDAPVLDYRKAVPKEIFDGSYLDKINRLLRKTFDPQISHLPDDILLSKQLEAREFLGVTENSEIVTLLQRRIENKRFYINQIINRGPKENVHAVLLDELFVFASNGGKIVYSWIEEDNIASVRFHEKYGLKRDGTYVIVFSYHKAE